MDECRRRRRSVVGVAAAATVFCALGTIFFPTVAAFMPPAPSSAHLSASRPAAADASSRSSSRSLTVAMHARSSKAGSEGKEGKPSASSSSSKKSGSSSSNKKAGSKSTVAAAAAVPTAATEQQLTPVPEGAALYDEALLEGGLAHEKRHEGDTTFNLMGQSEDVIAPWSVGGFEVDLPDWRPQPSAAYAVDVGAEVVAAVEEKVANMFGSSLRLVSTQDGVWRFFYQGNTKNLIGAEAWTKLLLQEDLCLPEVKEVRFETNYVRDWPDDWN